MRKVIAMVLVLLLAAMIPGAYADGYVMAGFDSDSSGHDWENNMFFRRMEEKTGVVFSFSQFRSMEDWKPELERMMTGGSAMHSL